MKFVRTLLNNKTFLYLPTTFEERNKMESLYIETVTNTDLNIIENCLPCILYLS